MGGHTLPPDTRHDWWKLETTRRPWKLDHRADIIREGPRVWERQEWGKREE